MGSNNSVVKKGNVQVESKKGSATIKFDASDKAVAFSENAKEVTNNISSFSSDVVSLGNIVKDTFEIKKQILMIPLIEKEAEQAHNQIMKEMEHDYKTFVAKLDDDTKRYLANIDAHLHKFDSKFKTYDIDKSMDSLNKIIDKILDFNYDNIDERRQHALDKLHDLCNTLMNKIFEI